MAGHDITRLGKETRHRAQTVGILIGIVIAVAWSDAANAAFTIITKHGTYTSVCYQIQGRTMRLCSGDQILFSDVTDIDDSRLTPEERFRQSDAIAQCYQGLDILLEADARIAEDESKDLEFLEYIVDLRSGDKPGKRFKDALSDAAAMLDRLETNAQKNKQTWGNINLPDRIFLPLRDIKNLQYTARVLCYQEWRRHLRNGDITLREYAREHHRQVLALEQRFLEHLEKIRAITMHDADTRGDVFPAQPQSESDAPEPIIIPEWPQ